ncbi:pyruvate, phosphate dikinase [Candidatus Bandiella euplotis]|uniref:Pyruvate, phosphate dikinase n=1 Tax=Candidatus Bandiella euplotis TaxID=1664265 RepID=A0ABZ0UNP4_9RICK|nr:pyruvate, phosphate dikinase [Candidatus Bandiella woodruffii]WPX96465.1 Pyruvate, phosphate dikinase [Candidatus Bandiella woodruffii]
MNKQNFAKKYVYNFGAVTEGDDSVRHVLGNKGAGLAQMCKIQIPVPPGFTISTEACNEYAQNSNSLPNHVKSQVKSALELLETETRLKLGDANTPLLVSVRSGAQISMPGMMETILNLGLNDITVEGLARSTNNPKFAYDCYRRYIEMYSHVVLKIDKIKFENTFHNRKNLLDIKEDCDLSVDDIKMVISEYKDIVKVASGKSFPQDIEEQLWMAIAAVFQSWNTPRAVKYREIYGITDNLGTAVNVQTMVFGNKGNNSATGVTFTRNPSTGEKEIFGEFLINAQGEDIVSGVKTPNPINISSKEPDLNNVPSMEELMPQAYGELKNILQKLERHYNDMQDVEFTVEEGKCWILQTRSGKRTATAAIRIAIDMLNEGILNKNQVLNSIEPNLVEKILHPNLDPKALKTLLTKGLPASPGAASGKIALSSERAETMARNDNVILVRNETSPEDIGGIDASSGVLTGRGGMTSHAAVVARGMGKPCITGASEILVNTKTNTLKINDAVLSEGDYITINGATGEVFLGSVATIQPKLDGYFKDLVTIAESVALLKVMANAETIKDAQTAKSFGAEGIGLCRTEHMFFQTDRINIFRKMILSNNKSSRISILNELLPFQQDDFYQLFKIMDGLPVTIRLLDPPLHEFLPDGEQELLHISKSMSISLQNVQDSANMLKEVNPMLGHRGCRLAITYPEIYQMQVKAILKAAYDVKHEGINVIPEIMVPLVMNGIEFLKMKKLIIDTAEELEKELGVKIDYKIGSMIELPAAAINAGEIAKEADFISFGTNDLTQTVLGISRDDAGKFLREYMDKDIFKKDPFSSIDQKTVGKLLTMAVLESRKSNPKIKIGICGEHAGDPNSIEFFDSIKVDYVSCSPFRIPVAKVAVGKYGSVASVKIQCKK